MLLYKERIKNNTQILNETRQALLIVLTCEKLFTNYQYFQREANWGNSDVLEEVIVLYYEFINGNEISKKQITELEKAVEVNIPDLDEVEHPLVSYGFDAGIAFLEALNYLKEKDIAHLIEVISGAINTVDMFVQEKEDLDSTDKDFEIKIENDPYMQREIKRQELILLTLQKMELDQQTISELRKLNTDMGNMIDFSLLSY